MDTMQIEITNANSRHFTITSAIEGIIAEALANFKKNGYTLSFRRETDGLYCVELQQWIMPKGFSVDQFYYFRAVSNPDADRKLYAISLSQGAKGIMLDSCFVYSDNISPEMFEKLNPHLQNSVETV
jgi:hypothetical protein